MKVEFSGDSIITSCPNSWSCRTSPEMETVSRACDIFKYEAHGPFSDTFSGKCHDCGVTLKASTIDGFTEVFNVHYGLNGGE